MGSESSFKLPVINLMDECLKSGESSRIRACKFVTQAFEEYGCFVAVHDKFSSELSDSIFIELQDLFNLPKEIKIQNTFETPLFGYFGANAFITLYECTSIEDATNLEAIQKFADQMWPFKNDHFSEMLRFYAKQVAELDRMASKMAFESYGVEKYHESHGGSVTYLVRFTKYRVPQMNKMKLGVLPHNDDYFITTTKSS